MKGGEVEMKRLIVMLALMFLVSVGFIRTTASTPYDPWCDIDDDGDIDIYDVVDMAGRYGTTGDSTKNVTVVNWPATSETTVWFSSDSFPVTSAIYDRSGFTNLHILMRVLWAGPGSSIDFQVRGIIWNFTHVESRYAVAYQATLTEPRNALAVTIPVPSDNFYFHVELISGDATVFLSFHLTWT